MAMKASTLVTGANGFLGQYLMNQLGPKAFGLTRGGPMTYEMFFAHPERFIEPGATLYHLAFARTSDENELEASLALAEKMASLVKMGLIRRVVDASSQSVYAPYRRAPASETDNPAPGGAYGVAKLKVEEIFDDAGPALHLRLAALCGPRLNNRLPWRLCLKALSEGALEVTSGEERLSFLWGEDAASACVVAGQSDLTGPLNVGTEEWCSVADLAQLVAQACHRLGHPVTVTVGPAIGPAANTTLNVERLSALGWKAQRSLTWIVDRTLELLKGGDHE